MNKSFRNALICTATVALFWLVMVFDWLGMRWTATRLSHELFPNGPTIGESLSWLAFGMGAVLAGVWIWWARKHMGLVPRRLVYTLAFVPLWQFTVFFLDFLSNSTFLADYSGNLANFRASAAQIGLATFFFLGLAWTVWGIEQTSRYYDRLRASGKLTLAGKRNWNPLDLDAWYYGRQTRKLRQSLVALASYSLAFMVTMLILSQLGGCQEIYEMPAGGGEQQQVVQQLKVQKVIKKKFVINPFSAIVFNPPPIEDIKLQLQEITKHAYTVGYGEGKGAGFSGGTNRGKVRFIRLEYSGGDWDQDFGVGADLNMLIEYNVRTSHPVADRTEARTVSALDNFPVGKSPPFVYMTGQRSISLSNSEVKTLREYLIDKHGMLFGDNGGSQGFHNQFFAMMRKVLPNVQPVRVPLDDPIHSIPFKIPFLPYVAPHGGKDAWGWKVDGRWVCYYHPGDIGDAWTDDHAGVRPEVWEACYQLGTNVIFYAHVEYNKWLDARKKD